MQTAGQDGDFDDPIASFSPDIQAIARRLTGADRHGASCGRGSGLGQARYCGYGIGPKKMSEHYAYTAPQTKHVNLGFYHGAALPDPAGVLEGTGKALPHVKVRSLAETDDEALRQLLQAALAERRTALKRE